MLRRQQPIPIRTPTQRQPRVSCAAPIVAATAFTGRPTLTGHFAGLAARGWILVPGPTNRFEWLRKPSRTKWRRQPIVACNSSQIAQTRRLGSATPSSASVTPETAAPQQRQDPVRSHVRGSLKSALLRQPLQHRNGPRQNWAHINRQRLPTESLPLAHL